MNAAPEDPMPRLICVTPDEARLAQEISARLRATWQVRPLCPGSANAGALAAGILLPLGDLYHVLTWLDHMAGD